MIDFPIDDLMAEEACLNWPERHLHPEGLKRPKCETSQRCVAQQNGYWPAWRCKGCDHYYTLLSGTVFEKTRQPPSKVVLLLRGIAKGESTARLSRELGIGRVRPMTCWKLRTYLRSFRGFHKKYLARYVATFEAMTNAKLFTPAIFRRMYLIQRAAQSKET